MKRYIILFFCITYCATAMGQNWLLTLIQCCLPTQRPQQAGIKIEAKLYQQGQQDPISSDSRFYYKDPTNYYVPAYDPIELSTTHAENRITLDNSTVTGENAPAVIKFVTRFGQKVVTQPEVTIGINRFAKVDFTEPNFYAIISASKATRELR